MAILLMLAGALVIGGGAALLVWLMQDQGGIGGSGILNCEAVSGRVEIARGDSDLEVKEGRGLQQGQELRCRLGSAAQLVTRDPEKARFVLRGPGTLQVEPESVKLHKGLLVFHYRSLPEGIRRTAIRAGNFIVESRGPSVGLVSVSETGTVRLAMQTGQARLISRPGSAGIAVKAGFEVSVKASGDLSGPRKISAGQEFELLKKPSNGD
jgi:hypothetical protein